MSCGARDEQGVPFALDEGTEHGRACLPVLKLEEHECLKLPSNSNRLLFAIVVTINKRDK